ncbi:hypothetical protein ACIP46_27490 [Streptomyces lavendulae]|uniref:hypothetical protein n=1 Tax=Streptomyces lavendulae TaxID=1914 RepID=UPI0033C5B669
MHDPRNDLHDSRNDLHHSRSDWLDDLAALTAGAVERFPRHNDAFHLVSRLAEESGELAQQVNHMEGMGRKREAHGEPDPDHLTKEVLDVVRCAVAIAAHYGCLANLRTLTSAKLDSYRREGWAR